MTEDVKPDYYSLLETRPTTPIPDAAYLITMDAYLEESSNMSKEEKDKLSSNTKIKKILLDLLGKYPDMWEVTNMDADKKKWQELGVELYSYTGKVIGEAALRLMFGNMKGLMKRKLTDYIDYYGSSHQEMEIALRKWELYSHFRWYRRHIPEYEQALWDKKEILNVVETDEVVLLGQYYNSSYVLQGEYNPADVRLDEEIECEDDNKEGEMMDVAPIEPPVRDAPGQQDEFAEDVEDTQDDDQDEEMDEVEEEQLQHSLAQQDEFVEDAEDRQNGVQHEGEDPIPQDDLDGVFKEDQTEELTPVAAQKRIVKKELQEEAMATEEQVPARIQTIEDRLENNAQPWELLKTGLNLTNDQNMKVVTAAMRAIMMNNPTQALEIQQRFHLVLQKLLVTKHTKSSDFFQDLMNDEERRGSHARGSAAGIP